MNFITFLGNPSDPPTITGNDTASSVGGRDGRTLKTFQSATVAVDANYFMAVNIKFEVSIVLYHFSFSFLIMTYSKRNKIFPSFIGSKQYV